MIPLIGVSVSEVTIVMITGILLGMAVYFALLKVLDPKVYQGVRHHIGLVIEGLPYLSR